MEKNFDPIYIYKHRHLNFIRIDNINTPPSKDYYLYKKIFVIKPGVTYSKLNGSINLYLYNHNFEPFNTINVSFNNNLNKYHNLQARGIFSLLVIKTFQFTFENSNIFYIENDFYFPHRKITMHETNINHNQTIDNKRFLFPLVYFDKPLLYWKCLPNCICIPTDDEKQYDTRTACMYNCFNNNIYGNQVYINDSSKVLHDIFKN